MADKQSQTKHPTIVLVSPSAHYPSHNWPISAALMRALRLKGYNVRAVIFTSSAEPVAPDLAADVQPVFQSPPPGWRRVAEGKWQDRHFAGLMNVFETIACLFKARKLARQSEAAALHFIGGSYWVVTVAALFFRRLRFVYSLYGPVLSGPTTGIKGRIRPFLKKLLGRAAATDRFDFTCENDWVRDEVRPLVGDHVHVVPYAIDDTRELPSKEEARRKLDLPLKEQILLFFGTHRREKDYHTPLQGCRTLSAPPLAFFVGKVISSNDPRKVVADCNYPKSLIVDDFVPEEMIPFYFAAADAVVLPYESNFSRGSGVLIECCGYLRPMIASATPYFSKFIDRYQCGVTFTAGDSASFAQAATSLLTGPERFQSALKRAQHDHSWSSAASQYIKLYRPPVSPPT